MVIGGTDDKLNQAIEDYDEAFENHDDIKQGALFLFSDSARARITTVNCQRP